MESAYVHFLSIDDGDATVYRWQNFWPRQTIEWQGEDWEWIPFQAGGIISGDVGSESSLSVDAPVTADTISVLRNAHRFGWWVTFQGWEFDGAAAVAGVPPTGVQRTQYEGEVVGLSTSFTRLTFEVGIPLAPIGVNFPPRSMTTTLIGVPCQLEA